MNSEKKFSTHRSGIKVISTLADRFKNEIPLIPEKAALHSYMHMIRCALSDVLHVISGIEGVSDDTSNLFAEKTEQIAKDIQSKTISVTDTTIAGLGADAIIQRNIRGALESLNDIMTQITLLRDKPNSTQD